MAVKASKKDVRLNFFYSIGAAIVILGALFKINHYSILGMDGSTVLLIGMGMEVVVFTIFALDPPKGEYEWERAYPELSDGSNAVKSSKKNALVAGAGDAEVTLSNKLDKMLADAKLDSSLMTRLRDGIDNFSHAVADINKTVDASSATQAYGDQLALAANHMEGLNALYQVQLDNGKKQVELNKKFINEMEKSASGSEHFMSEMNKLTENVNNLNKVYGGMLTAMRNPGV